MFPHAFFIDFASVSACMFLSTTNAMSFFTLGNFDISLYFGLPVFISKSLSKFISQVYMFSFVTSGCSFPIIPTF